MTARERELEGAIMDLQLALQRARAWVARHENTEHQAIVDLRAIDGALARSQVVAGGGSEAA